MRITASAALIAIISTGGVAFAVSTQQANSSDVPDIFLEQLRPGAVLE